MIPQLMCDVCKKPVELVIWGDSPSGSARTFIVKCHGETEKCSLSYEELIEGSVAPSVAFENKTLRGNRGLFPA